MAQRGSVFLSLELAMDQHTMKPNLKHFLLSFRNVRGPDYVSKNISQA